VNFHKMMTYLLDTRSATPHFPGIGRYVRNLAHSLPALLAEGEALMLLPTPGQQAASPFSLAQQWQIPGLVRQSGAWLYHSPYYLMPYRPGTPTVLTVYDIISLRYPQTVSARARLFFRLTSTLALRAATRVIAISEAARGDFMAAFGVPAEKIVAIPLAAEAHFKPQEAGEIERVRQKYGLAAPFALYLGINKPHKNLERLVRAWQRVRSGGWQLAIGGAWDSRYPQVRQLAKGDSSICFLGSIPEGDLPGLYAAAGLFAFPSLYEGFGLPVLEAMACGTPVICANTSSLPEVGGDAVAYFNPLDEAAIGAALRQATADADLRRDLAQRGLARAKLFSWERCAAQTLSIYRQITKP
jgi:alpha-1,3-rhamnosyl/mannosyltransferase